MEDTPLWLFMSGGSHPVDLLTWLAGFCLMRAALGGYFQTDYGSKILLLLNLLFFINVFEVATLVDHHPAPAMIV